VAVPWAPTGFHEEIAHLMIEDFNGRLADLETRPKVYAHRFVFAPCVRCCESAISSNRSLEIMTGSNSRRVSISAPSAFMAIAKKNRDGYQCGVSAGI
jgi:hypothetical protein